jgi:hypothetical protein
MIKWGLNPRAPVYNWAMEFSQDWTVIHTALTIRQISGGMYIERRLYQVSTIYMACE